MTSCPQCTKDAVLLFEANDPTNRADTTVFSYYRCASCSLVFIDPIPANLSDYYKEDYGAYGIPESTEKLEALGAKLHWRLALLQQFKKNGTLLEIGPSFGAFAHEAARGGFRVDAIEMDRRCCEFINSHTQVHAINATDTLAALKELQSYDAIAMWHSIEHMSDPWTLLKEIAQHLNTGGVLILSTPNPSSFQFSIFGKYWRHLDAPRHLELIPPALLDSFLKTVGMERELFTTVDPDGLNLNAMGWYQSSRFGHHDSRTVLQKIAGRVVKGLFSIPERMFNKGAAYTVIYRKRA